MDKASILGSIIGFAACVLVMWMASAGNFTMFYSSKGFIMVFSMGIAM
jgi:flagellar motor component MotA